MTVTTSAGTSAAAGFTVLPCDAPTVTIAGADSAWHSHPVDLTVTATVDPALSLASLDYTTDGGASWAGVPGSGTSRTLTISENGTTTVQVRAIDSASQTATGEATVRIDRDTPTLRLAARSLTISSRGDRPLRLRLLWSDAVSSRATLKACITQYGRLKHGPCRLTLTRRGHWQVLTLPLRPKAPGRYTLHLVLTDQSGRQCRASAIVVARR